MKVVTPRSWLKDVWIAKRNEPTQDTNGNLRVTYQTPVKYTLNHQPISSSTDIEMFGANAQQVQRAHLVAYPSSEFNELDLAYLDGANPTDEVSNGANANYVVKRIMIQNISTVVYFEKLSGLNNGRI